MPTRPIAHDHTQNLQSAARGAKPASMTNELAANLDLPPAPDAELAPPGTPPHVAVAPGLPDQPHVVAREDDDTGADYEARSRLLAAALRVARQG